MKLVHADCAENGRPVININISNRKKKRGGKNILHSDGMSTADGDYFSKTRV